MTTALSEQPIPIFLDFEASSLADRSYPIEVAWNLDDGSIESHLISPKGISNWTDWNSESEKVHGIKRSQLLSEGRSPFWVRNRMNERLAGKPVYTDAPQFDGMWLARLYESTGGGSPTFELHSVDELLVRLVCPSQAGRILGLIKIVTMKEEARKLVPGRHRAAWDVQYLLELWKLAVRSLKSPPRDVPPTQGPLAS